MEAFEARCLPLRKEDLDPSVYMEALIDATARLQAVSLIKTGFSPLCSRERRGHLR